MSSILTLQMVTRAAVRILSQSLHRLEDLSLTPYDVTPPPPALFQADHIAHWVSFLTSSEEKGPLRCNLDDFAAIYLEPAMIALARKIQLGNEFIVPDLPEGVLEKTIQEFDGVILRGVLTWYPVDKITGRLLPPPSWIHREENFYDVETDIRGPRDVAISLNFAVWTKNQ